MKKAAILASAVAMALTAGAAQAAPTWYGKVRLFVELGTEVGTDDRQSLRNYSSRVGVKGKEDLGNGMSAFYRWEAQTNDEQGGATSSRLLYGGIEGDFGQFGMGSQWTPTYLLVRGVHDPFSTTAGGNNFGYGFAAPARTADAIWYLNKFGPATFAIAIVANETTLDTGATSETLNDATDIALTVPVGPVTLGVAMQSYDALDPTPTAIDVGWKGGDLSVNLGFFMPDVTGVDDGIALTAKFNTGSGKIIAQFEDDGTNDQFSAGYHHMLSKKTSLVAELTSGDLEADQTNLGIHINF